MFGVLLSSFINGNPECHIGRRHLRFRLLSTSDGGAIRNKCFNHDSVSKEMSLSENRNVIYFLSLPRTSLNRGLLGTVVTGFSIMWCALSASKLFVTSLSMDHQQILVAYPAALFYGVFALITIF